MQPLNRPMPNVAVREHRRADQDFSSGQHIRELVSAIGDMSTTNGTQDRQTTRQPILTREDLHLICFYYVCS